jgi:hypothetical protein
MSQPTNPPEKPRTLEEIQALFGVDKTEAEFIRDVSNGTIAGDLVDTDEE